MVHQHFRLVGAFTVAENVVLGDHRGEARTLRLHPRRIERRVAELGEQYGLAVDPRAKLWQLSLGEQQRVEILKALYRQSKVLILDEPTAVLTPQEAETLFGTVRSMAAEGRTIVFISHKLNEVKEVADHVTVLRGGRSVATAPTADATPQSLAELMVGRELASTLRERVELTAEDEIVLEVEDLWADGDRGETALRGVSLQVRAGEILAVAGVAGNGQRELAEAITGLRAPTRGRISVRGRQLPGGDPRRAIRAGVAHVPEDRLGTGVAPSLTVASNAALKSYRSHGPFLRRRAIRRRADELIRRFDVRGATHATPARQLSGGNLQKVVLGREFAAEPSVLVAASPTRGLDVAAIASVHGHLRDAAAEGMAILLISEDLDEILALANRVVVLYEGELAGEVDPHGATVNEIGLLMAGGTRA
jgi:simple sugar transport system ATP-binding protein